MGEPELHLGPRPAPVSAASPVPPEAWHGIYPAALTMFTSSGGLDEVATERHLKKLMRDGAHGLVVGGTSGEFISLSESERRTLIELAVACVAGRIPVIAGTGFFATAPTVALTKFAESTGADGAIVILPYYQRPTEAEVVDHFRTLGHATNLPVMIYNNPMNSGAPGLGATAIRKLYEGGSVRAVKSTFPTVHEIQELRAELDERFRVFYGSFQAPLEALAGGADGWISGILNVATLDALVLWGAMQEEDLVAARAAWRRILWIKQIFTRQELGLVGDLAIYRGILRLTGETSGHCRPPLRDLDKPQLVQLEKILHKHQAAASQAEMASVDSDVAARRA
jgi:4-hydroxy-tetrahydrodipicolinate synthase